MELKSIFVEVEGLGQVEIREPLFSDIESFFDSDLDQKKFGINLLKKCLYQDGKLVFEQKLSAAVGMRLIALAPQVMQMVGFSDAVEADDSAGKP